MDPNLVALLSVLSPTVLAIGVTGTLLVAIINLQTARITADRTKEAAEYAKETHTIAVESKANIQLIEKATNSMKDALVKATGDAKMAEGMAAGRAEMKQEASPHTKGELEVIRDLLQKLVDQQGK